ncbi:MAG: LEPR-XLL domain-containing protein [Candidatus Saccharimonas sp.]|nr:LEPR-XLL domain-containing protein [Planctomycetaceae bacterium]
MVLVSWLTALYRRVTTRGMPPHPRRRRTHCSSIPAFVETLEPRVVLAAAVIGSPTVADVTENLNVNGSGNLVASGSISITDADPGEASFQTSVISAGGNLGSLVLASDGVYTYTVGNKAVQFLGAGATQVDTFTVTALDGTTKDVAFTMHGVEGSVILTGTTLDIDGTTLADTITVTGGANLTVTLNGVPFVYNLASVSTITVDGLNGNDIVSIASNVAQSATLNGGSGNDTLTGGGGNDTLVGGADNDVYVFDTDAALGSDTINEAGGGIDTLDFSGTTTRVIQIDLWNSAAQVINGGLTLTLSADNTLENIIGGALGDNLFGNDLNNRLTGGGGNDTLGGWIGNDTYVFDTDLALGSDTISGEPDMGSSDTLDFSETTRRAVAIVLWQYNVAQFVNTGLTLTLATTEVENATGGSFGDTLAGGSSNFFNASGSILTGNAGNDRYAWGMYGGTAIEQAGEGIDTLSFAGSGNMTVDLTSDAALATLPGNRLVNTGGAGQAANFENVIGGSGHDTLIGNASANKLVGNGGKDILSGGGGNDTLDGGDGTNILVGGLGLDTLLGGAGEDLMLGGSIQFADNAAALQAMRSEWARTDNVSVADRVAHLLGTLAGGNNGSTVLNSTTVKDDEVKDVLTGGSGKDWYLRNSQSPTVSKRDVVNDVDVAPFESVFTEIDTWL